MLFVQASTNMENLEPPITELCDYTTKTYILIKIKSRYRKTIHSIPICLRLFAITLLPAKISFGAKYFSPNCLIA